MTKDEKIDSLEKEILDLKKSLEIQRKKNILIDKVCIQQSKMAAIGEIIGDIAHQWRQPLMELSSILMIIESKIEFEGSVSVHEMLDAIHKSNTITKSMSKTIDDFRNFFSKEKEKTNFKLSEQIKRVIHILQSFLKNQDIRVSIILKANPIILGFKNEYSQALINLITNAKEAIIMNNIKEGKIDIRVYQEDNMCITEITDNAGGINEEQLNELFKPFTSFGKKDNSGLGLFLTKLIIENNFNGKLLVENTQNGAKFKILIPITN